MSKKKLRKIGDIMTDLEPYLFELMGNGKNEHDMQLQEVFAQIEYWAKVHCRGAIPTYTDGTKPKLKGTDYGYVK